MKRCMVIGAHLVGVSESRIVNSANISRVAGSGVLIAYTNIEYSHPKTQDYTAADDVRNEYRASEPLFMNKIQWKSHAANIHGRSTIPKLLV
ncbi:hypothetical protein TNCV_2522001 [Trichonephila clavipes]|nr:hypothetical protein TNCV_2522001 [Trichonephila clavipes]